MNPGIACTGNLRAIFAIWLLLLTISNSVLAKVPGAGNSVDSLTVLDSLVNIHKVNDNIRAVRYARRALVIANASNSESLMAQAYKLMGVAYFPLEKDSSYLFFTMALDIAERAGLKAMKIPILYNLAMINHAAHNYQDAIKLLDTTINLAKEAKDYLGMARAYIALGTINESSNDFLSARKMYETALEVAGRDSLFQMLGAALGNLAKFEFEKDNARSLAMMREALSYLKKVRGTEEEMAYILINMGNRFTDPDSALFYYKSALGFTVNANLPAIQFGAYNNMAYSYLDKKQVGMAESCLKDHAIPVAVKNNNHDWLSSLYDTYADVCVVRGDYQMALGMQKKAMKERSIDTRQKAAEQLRLLSALLDLKNKELIIRNEEALLLKQRNRLQRTELGLAITALLVFLSIFTIIIMQLRIRARLHREEIASAKKLIEMEEAEKGRTARELHDLTGQLMLGVSGALENTEFPDPEEKEYIRNRIQELGTSMRHISHRMNRALIEHFSFSELITGLCDDYRTLLGLHITLTVPDSFPELSSDLILHVYRITQELLTNAGKHARESSIILVFTTDKNRLYLNYQDDGKGFQPEVQKKKTMGIMNIYERAKLCYGTVALESSPGKGTKWEISFPLNK